MITNAVTVEVNKAVSFTVISRRCKNARAVFVACCGVEVASGQIGAAGELVVIADFIAIGVEKAESVAVQAFFRVGALATGIGSVGVPIAGIGIQATADGHREVEVYRAVDVVSVEKQLNVKVAG